MGGILNEVANQPPPLEDYNLFSCDLALQEALEREGAGWARARVTEFGRLSGSAEAIHWGFQANENAPVLHTHDRFGNRRDEVEFHPAWHELMRRSVEYGLHNLSWLEARPGAQVARAALMLVGAQNEAGHLCPLSMTHASLPVLRREPNLACDWEPRILSTSYDPRFLPACEKSGALVGMAMTEKQGGSDLRANTTQAEPLDAPGEFLITGHKWFCSAPMCDAFLVLARAPGGLACFLLPRWTPEGKRNAFFLQRLKSKVGNRSNASSEVELSGAWARRVGEEGRGVAIIMEMVQSTRLDCTISSAGLTRQAVTQAIHHARHRSAFGHTLTDQPLMCNVLADLAVESEAATLLAMRLARAFDAAASDPREHGLARLATAAAKYWVCKRAPAHVAEALECLGGNGYVEESILPRLYREAPVNSVWEGPGNVISLDLLRALDKEPSSRDSLLAEIAVARGESRGLDAFASALERDLACASEESARRLAARVAVALEASLVLRHSPHPVPEAFLASRLAGEHTFGTLPAGIDFRAIIDRAWPPGQTISSSIQPTGRR